MLVEAAYQPAAGPADTVEVKFSQPDMQLMGEMVQSTEYEIEYPTALMPSLKIDETIVIAGGIYIVRAHPEKVGDGYFSKAKLSKQ